MSQEASAYYQELFKKVFNSKKWQDYRTKKSLQGDALMSYWKKERDIHEVMLKNMGVIN
jgi:tripartite-type tricarboxylate transporter receptor subunit TctC